MFQHKEPSAITLVTKIKEDAKTWALAKENDSYNLSLVFFLCTFIHTYTPPFTHIIIGEISTLLEKKNVETIISK